jgi:hypothetical protein
VGSTGVYTVARVHCDCCDDVVVEFLTPGMLNDLRKETQGCKDQRLEGGSTNSIVLSASCAEPVHVVVLLYNTNCGRFPESTILVISRACAEITCPVRLARAWASKTLEESCIQEQQHEEHLLPVHRGQHS